MFLILQSLTPRQRSLIKNLRLDINHLAGGVEWGTALKIPNLASLRDLRNGQLFFTTYERFIFDPTTMRFRKSHLVHSVLRMSTLRPSAVVSQWHGRVDYTNEQSALVGSEFYNREMP